MENTAPSGTSFLNRFKGLNGYLQVIFAFCALGLLRNAVEIVQGALFFRDIPAVLWLLWTAMAVVYGLQAWLIISGNSFAYIASVAQIVLVFFTSDETFAFPVANLFRFVFMQPYNSSSIVFLYCLSAALISLELIKTYLMYKYLRK